jgi:hypothetical protein
MPRLCLGSGNYPDWHDDLRSIRALATFCEISALAELCSSTATETAVARLSISCMRSEMPSASARVPVRAYYRPFWDQVGSHGIPNLFLQLIAGHSRLVRT